MLAMGLGIGSTALLGTDASFLSLMPSFAVIGLGGGMTIPLTATVLSAMPTSQAGVASAVFNASREVAGLLGITVIGAVLTSRQGAALAAGHTPADAYPHRVPRGSDARGSAGDRRRRDGVRRAALGPPGTRRPRRPPTTWSSPADLAS